MSGYSERGVLIVAGPTASGKTSFAIDIAERYDAEIVSADSRQIYRGMPIGTAAPTPPQRARVRHHLIDFVAPDERYSAARFVADAMPVIARIQARGKHVIVVGGTGFYVRALCGDVDLAREPDPAIRSRVVHETRIHPVEVLHGWLAARAPARAAAVSAGDPYRIGRALEIELARTPGERCARTGTAAPLDRHVATQALPTLRAAGIPFAKVALRADPATLASRIEERTATMLHTGLIEEAERIGTAAVAANAVGYREALAYTNGWLTFEELRQVLARATRQYAKRQRTWFRTEPNVIWIEAGDMHSVAQIVARLGWHGRGP